MKESINRAVQNLKDIMVPLRKPKMPVTLL